MRLPTGGLAEPGTSRWRETPSQVLASLASVFGDFDVSIESVVQRALPDGDAEIVWITHRALEANIRSALDVIGRLDIVTGIQNWIRVEE